MKSRCSFYEKEEKIIGTSGMSFIEKPPYFGCPSGKIGPLSSMFTDPDYRRMGIAKELLHRVVEEAREYGCGTIQITASRSEERRVGKERRSRWSPYH